MTRAEILAEIEALKVKAAEMKAKTVADAKAEIDLILEHDGITLADVGLAKLAVKVERKPAAIKYRKGEHSWSGRGKQPAWVADHLAAGGTLEQIAV